MGANALPPATPAQSDATAVISSAAGHQARASESQLGHSKVQGNASRHGPLHQNLAKAKALVAEQKARKMEVALFDAQGGPKISVSLWASLGEARNFKMESVRH